MWSRKREYKEMLLNRAEGQKIADVTLAAGDRDSALSEAEGYKADRIGTAQAEAGQMTSMFAGTDSLSPGKKEQLEELAKTQTKYRSLQDVLAPVNKIIVDKRVNDVQLYQTSNNPFVPRPPGQ